MMSWRIKPVRVPSDRAEPLCDAREVPPLAAAVPPGRLPEMSKTPLVRHRRERGLGLPRELGRVRLPLRASLSGEPIGSGRRQ